MTERHQVQSGGVVVYCGNGGMGPNIYTGVENSYTIIDVVRVSANEVVNNKRSRTLI
jgi:hypothetical protein